MTKINNNAQRKLLEEAANSNTELAIAIINFGGELYHDGMIYGLVSGVILGTFLGTCAVLKIKEKLNKHIKKTES